MGNPERLQREIEVLKLKVRKLQLERRSKSEVCKLKKQKKGLEKQVGKGAFRDFFTSKIRQFAKSAEVKNLVAEVMGKHSNPRAFVSMLAGNKSMSDVQKVKSLKTYIRKHGRRSSTLD